jgi:hypothetical protein
LIIIIRIFVSPLDTVQTETDTISQYFDGRVKQVSPIARIPVAAENAGPIRAFGSIYVSELP